MTIKGHILRTASEIAMGRYMRAPDHKAAGLAADEDFSAAFADFSKDEPAAGADGSEGGDNGAGDDPGAGAAGGDGAGGDDGAGADDGGEGAAAGVAGDEGAAGTPPADDAAAEKTKAGEGEAGDAAAADATTATNADTGAKGDKGKGAKDKAPAAAASAADSDDANDVLKRLANLVKDQPGADDKGVAAPAAEEAPLFTAEEEQKLDHFRKEWPEVAEAFDLQAKGLAHSVLKYAFSQIGEQFTPLKEMVENLAARTHYGDLTDKVGSYTDEERDEIIGWVGEHPAYLQTAMMSVINEGTAEEVADLVSRYREATGKQPAGAQAADTGAPGGDTELSGEAKKAAASLAPVSSKRSAVQAPEDKSDFDGAFAKFVDMI